MGRVVCVCVCVCVCVTYHQSNLYVKLGCRSTFVNCNIMGRVVCVCVCERDLPSVKPVCKTGMS